MGKDVLTRSPEAPSHDADLGPPPHIVGESPPYQRVRSEMRTAASVDYPVTIVGESGTGKELVASLLHRLGPRRAAPYVAFNCAAVPENLLESHLFGHRRGSFTGAHRDAKGLFEEARGGTLLLDEVHLLSPLAQAKLLRVVDTGDYLAVGSTRPQRSHARLLATTNVDLETEVDKGAFRRDLYYRLHVLVIKLPSLRNVRADIPVLVEHFVGKLSERLGRPRPQVSPQALAALVAAPWHGNVRQLIHELERALLSCRNGSLPLDALSANLRNLPDRPAPHCDSVREIARALEIEQIRRGLERTGWNVAALAREMNLSRRGLTGKIARYGLRRPARPGSSRGAGAVAARGAPALSHSS